MKKRKSKAERIIELEAEIERLNEAYRSMARGYSCMAKMYRDGIQILEREIRNLFGVVTKQGVLLHDIKDSLMPIDEEKPSADVLLERAKSGEPFWGFYWDGKTIKQHKVYEMRYDLERGSEWQILLTLGHGNFEWYTPEEYGITWAFTLAELKGKAESEDKE